MFGRLWFIKDAFYVRSPIVTYPINGTEGAGATTGDIQLDVERGHQQEAGGDHGPDGQSRA